MEYFKLYHILVYPLYIYTYRNRNNQFICKLANFVTVLHYQWIRNYIIVTIYDCVYVRPVDNPTQSYNGPENYAIIKLDFNIIVVFN